MTDEQLKKKWDAKMKKFNKAKPPSLQTQILIELRQIKTLLLKANIFKCK